MAWHGMAWHGMVWHGMSWHGIVRGDTGSGHSQVRNLDGQITLINGTQTLYEYM